MRPHPDEPQVFLLLSMWFMTLLVARLIETYSILALCSKGEQPFLAATNGAAIIAVLPKRMPMQLEDSALAQARRANRAISKLYNLVLSSCGLRATQYVLLQSIAAAGEISQHQLSEQLSVATATLSRRLSGLKKRRLVEMRTAARGSRIYTLTPAGCSLLTSTSLQWKSAQRRLRSTLGEADWQIFINVCDRVCEAAKQAESMRIAFARSIID